MKAMILAAGRGERLKPLTNTTPKALIELNGQPLIVHHILNLKSHGINDIVINTAYLGKKIEQYIGNGEAFGVNITYSKEKSGGLETGGGIVNALPLLGKEPFIAVNADIYCPFNFEKLPKLNKSLAHLVLVNNPAHNPNGDYAIDGDYLSNRDDLNKYTFSGIAIYHPDFFKNCTDGKYSVTPIVKEMANKNTVSAELYPETWHDIGTQERLEIAQKALNHKNK